MLHPWAPPRNRDRADSPLRAPSRAERLRFPSRAVATNADPHLVSVFIALAAAGLALLFGAFALVLRWRRHAQAAAGVLVAMLCGRAVLAARADWEWALCPWPSYALVQGFVLYGLAAAFFGVAAATISVRWNRLVVLAVGLGVLAHGMSRHAWLAWPEQHGDTRVAGADHHVRQSSHYTCGPAACAAALSHCGVVRSERELAAACLTRRQGTSLFDLYRGLVLVVGDHPLTVSIEAVTAEQIVAENLVVVGANSGGGHAVAVAARGGRIVWHDPLQAAAQITTLPRLRDEFGSPAIVIRSRQTAATPWR